MMYLVMGRTAAGKDTAAQIMGEVFGFRQVVSATTRPRRSPDEDTHRFVTPEQAGAERDKVAQTEIGEYLYYATKSDVESADVYIIDPPGMLQLAHAMPGTDFVLVYMLAREEDRARAFAARAMAGDSSLTEQDALALFDKRNADENERFAMFAGLEKDFLARVRGQGPVLGRCMRPFSRPAGLPANVGTPLALLNPYGDEDALRRLIVATFG